VFLAQSEDRCAEGNSTARVDELPLYDAIIFGSPTRFGSVSRLRFLQKAQRCQGRANAD
jgi:hypothetical protein